MPINRRTFVAGAAALAAAPLEGGPARAAAATLTAAPGSAGLVVPDGPATKAWLYNGQAPGPVLRARQGDMLTIDVENLLPSPTTVHWHGLRVPIEMDGAPFLSQPPIPPGGRFTYRLPLEDAGTFWYHPHVDSSEQVGRGLNGVLIVEEPPEIAARLRADREVVWAIDDWRLDAEAQIAPFGGLHDAAHAGRIGNVLTVNGSYLRRETVRAGERLRLRMANVANAQSFRLRFAPLDPWLIALDGHPIPPRRLGADDLWLAAGQRADLIVDIALEPGAEMTVIDDSYGADTIFDVMTWRAADAPPLRDAPPPAPEMLPANPIAPPDLATAETHDLVFEGGARGGLEGAVMGGRFVDIRTLARAGKVWALNGTVPANLYATEPLFRLPLGTSHVIRLENRTRWPHPIHLHGHSFHVLPDGAPDLAGAAIRDTVLLQPDESARIAFVADNPGRWMLHCHVLEHQGGGMMGVVEVA